MLKIKGNREFWQWWDHWTSRLHSDRLQQSNPGNPGNPNKDEPFLTRTSQSKKKKQRAKLVTAITGPGAGRAV